MKVWITRDNTSSVSDFVKIWNRKPGRYYPKKELYCTPGDQIFIDPIFTRNPGWLIIDIYTFKKDFGFTPRKGSCREYELIIKKYNGNRNNIS